MTSTKVGEMLRRLRMEKGVSLRTVEKETGVSNAYLSQLESGKAEQPSPHILHKLAGYYGVHYSRLMEAAGHLKSEDEKAAGGVSPIQAALMEEGLNQQEQQMV
ncbi:MAG TPA: helix-turn-helix transcriptional regulator, partial [Pyrinomonadaceae bacterium]|nr:helix-turn-helix transcriptional regulator [Pyrinomonadaceae bacterium]